jgi:DNA helicase-2/ATP-dependent DNA helicase PcrA
MLTAYTAHLVVDEVFDANELDLAVVHLACEANVPVTLVGDPWQALYGFRGARPDLVPTVLTQWQFRSLPLSHSFRFQSPEMRRIGPALRERRPVSLAAGDEHDVVLASKWDLLWRGPDNVLPISFGRTANKTDAAAIVLLDHLVHSAFNQHAVFLPEALVLLELDPDAYRSDGSAILGGVVETLATHGPVRALSALREAMRTLGARRRPPAGAADPRQIERLTAVATRIRSGRELIPGLTIHQAKGREWDRVGVLLTEAELGRVSAGLDREVEADRALYVALTRARLQVRRA